ncbi:MAG: V-type ATPase subunit [candidate division WOR-3 bacterium]
MSDDYGYINARIRARFARLLRPEDYERLLSAEDLSAFFRELKETHYGPSLPSGDGGIEAILLGLRRHLEKTVSEVLGFSDGEPGDLFRIILGRWDVQNLITVLRGKTRGLPADEIARDLVPLGSLDNTRLSELLKEETPSDVLDRLASWNISLPIKITRDLTRFVRDGDIASAEFYLYEGYLGWARERLGRKENGAMVREVLDSLSDTRNIVGVLIYLKNRIKPAGRVRFLPGGKLGPHILRKLERCETYEDGVAVLRETIYKSAFPRPDTPLAEAERRIEIEALRSALSKRLHADPLGIGIGLSFLKAQETEVINLRTIALGIAYGADRREIREALIL